MEIIVPVPFEVFGRDPEALGEKLHQPRHTARQRGFRPGKPEAHRVAQPELDGHARLAAQLLQCRDERRDEPVQVGPGQVLQMAAGTQAGVDHGADDPRVVLRGLTAGSVHLEVDVVVRRRQQDSRFLDAGRPDALEIVQRRAHPGRHLGPRSLPAGGDRLAVDRGVGEELSLPEHRPTELIQQVVEMDDLLDGVRRARLLAVAERRVRDPDVRGNGLWDSARLEANRRNPAIWKVLAQQIRLGAIQHASFYAYVDLYCNLLTATIVSRTLELERDRDPRRAIPERGRGV